MILWPDEEVQEVIAAIRKAAVSFDHRFYGADKHLEGLLLTSVSIVQSYHDQLAKQHVTKCDLNEVLLRTILERIECMSQDINVLNATIAASTTVIDALNVAVKDMLAINAASGSKIDYTPQINALNASIQEAKNDTALIDAAVIPPVVVIPSPVVIPPVGTPVVTPVVTPEPVIPPVTPPAPTPVVPPVA